MTKTRRTEHLTCYLALWAFGTLLIASPLYAFAQGKPDSTMQLRAMPKMPLTKPKAKSRNLKPISSDKTKPGVSSTERTQAPQLAQAKGKSEGSDIKKVKIKECKPVKGRFPWNFEKAKILDVLDQISRLTCKNFIVSSSVKSSTELTIISRTPINVDQAYMAFLSAMEANNLALVPAGKFLKVVERKSAVKDALPFYEDPSKVPNTDAQITLLYQLKYTSKDAVQSLLKSLMSKTGDLQAVGDDFLIITDNGANIHRLLKILDKVDKSGSTSRIHIIDIVYAEASEIQGMLNEIFDFDKDGGKIGVGPSTDDGAVARSGDTLNKAKQKAKEGEEGEFDTSIDKIIADDRTNKLIVISSEGAFVRLREIIEILDIPASDSSSQGQVHVFYLNNADATKVASTLSSLAQAAKSGKKSGKSKGKKKGGKGAALFEGEVKVTADESTNSLVIISSPRDLKAVRNVIDMLDKRRPQVFVEAVIMEVGLRETIDLGLNAFSGYTAEVPGMDGEGFGVVSNPRGQSLVTGAASSLATASLTGGTSGGGSLSSAAGLANFIGFLAFRGPAIPGSEDTFGFALPSFGAVLNALQTNTNVDVLSTPHLMTTDNEKAEISVGQRVPVLKGSSFGGGGQGGFGGFGFPMQQVAYEDVKLKFAITPHVSGDDTVRLELEQEVSDIGGRQDVGNGITQPIITNRSAKTTVVARDQQTLVIGGLISTRQSDSESKIPLLGDLPLVGWLFKGRNADQDKTNLLVVLTPYVVRSSEDFRKIYERKMKERKEFVEAYYGDASKYNPFIDYSKKTGPLGKIVSHLDGELQKAENGGPGLPGEVVVQPKPILDGEAPQQAPPAPAPAPEGGS